MQEKQMQQNATDTNTENAVNKQTEKYDVDKHTAPHTAGSHFCCCC